MTVEIVRTPLEVVRAPTLPNENVPGRLRVLVSAYACEPGAGSEPGVGWNLVRELSEEHDLLVVTRSNNRGQIVEAIKALGLRGVTFYYHDLPRWARWWKSGSRGVQLYYYLWQLSARRVVARLVESFQPHLVHHLTFGKYWAPTCLSGAGLPFVWGPLGGGETAPWRFLPDLGPSGTAYELMRIVARRVAELDPFVLGAARTATVALASTPETAARLRALGVRDVRYRLQMGIAAEDLPASEPNDTHAPSSRVRFATMGRLLHWKGVHLAIKALAAGGPPGASLTVVGDGPQLASLKDLARTHGISDRVEFVGSLPRQHALKVLGKCDVFVHPSLHDQAPSAVFEALSLGKPVVCLALGGPALQVAEDVGFAVPAPDPATAVAGLAAAMSRLARDPDLRARMSRAARETVARRFGWDVSAQEISRVYREAVGVAANTSGVRS